MARRASSRWWCSSHEKSMLNCPRTAPTTGLSQHTRTAREEGRPLAYTKLVIDGPPSGLSGWIYTPTPGGMGREFTIYN